MNLLNSFTLSTLTEELFNVHSPEVLVNTSLFDIRQALNKMKETKDSMHKIKYPVIKKYNS